MLNPEICVPEVFFSLLVVGIVAIVCTSNWFKKLWEKHICGECNHPPECFDCNESNDACYKDGRCKLINKQ